MILVFSELDRLDGDVLENMPGVVNNNTSTVDEISQPNMEDITIK